MSGRKEGGGGREAHKRRCAFKRGSQRDRRWQELV